MKTNDLPGIFSSPTEVRIVRTLPGPIERVWEYLTVSDKRARWFCGGVVEQKAGGRIEFAMVHKNLAPDETPPARYAQVQDPGVTFEGRVIRCEPPTLLVFTFGSEESEVTFQLTSQKDTVRLELIHRVRGAEEEAELANYASGWHIHLTHLLAQLTGAPRPPFWSVQATLLNDYEKLRATQLKR